MALAVLFKLIDAKVIGTDDTVVVVSTAHGLKFTDFKTRYHADELAQQFGVSARGANQPVEVEANYDAVRGAILSSLECVAA